MAQTRSMTRNRNHDASTRKRIKTCDNGVVAPWLDLNDDVLFLVMMLLGVVDFLAFSGVCKSWRSVALCNRKRFMASKQPMSMCISARAYKKTCYLEDFEGRRFKTILPRSVCTKYVGLTCGYLVLYGEKTRDFWLVNPITRHELHFHDFPCEVPFHVETSPGIKAILVFSPSIGWLFVITERFCDQIWFSIAGKGVWNHVSTTIRVLDLHAFKGKVYTLNFNDVINLCEMRLAPEPKLMLLKTKNFPKIDDPLAKILSYNGYLYVVECISEDLLKVYELQFGEMKWVYLENTKDEYAFYKNKIKAWAGTDKSRKGRFNAVYMWYSPHECLDVDRIDE